MPDLARPRRNRKALKLDCLPTLAKPETQSVTVAAVADDGIRCDGECATASQTVTFIDQSDKIDEQLGSLQIGLECLLDIRAEDLRNLQDLGAGTSGTVSKVLYVPTRTFMARKIMKIESREETRRQIVRELQFMHECRSPYIVSFFGAYIQENNICVCMEFMDCGSLEKIRQKTLFSVGILGNIALSIVRGLSYLYKVHRIVHRDVKPSNVLLNSHGEIKLCDFGVSGQLINSIANTFVGTSFYMSPERIQGAAYTVKGDIWSVGVTLIELAIGESPHSSARLQNMSVLDLLQKIVMDDPPKLEGDFDSGLKDFVAACCTKNLDQRPNLDQLEQHEFLTRIVTLNYDLREWARQFI